MSSRTSVTSTTYGGNRSANYSSSRQQARQAVIAGRRQAVGSIPIDISRSTLNRLAGRMYNGELKTVDTAYAGVTLNATTTNVALLNGVASGANFFNRVGNKISPQSIDSDMIIANTSTTAAAWIWYRAALIWDKQPTGALPTYADIFQNIDSAGAASSTGLAGRNLQTTDRFQSIAMQDGVLQPLNAASSSPSVIRLKFFRTLAGRQQQFKGTTAAIGDISSGALYLVIAASTDATNTMSFWGDHRFRYHDA